MSLQGITAGWSQRGGSRRAAGLFEVDIMVMGIVLGDHEISKARRLVSYRSVSYNKTCSRIHGSFLLVDAFLLWHWISPWCTCVRPSRAITQSVCQSSCGIKYCRLPGLNRTLPDVLVSSSLISYNRGKKSNWEIRCWSPQVSLETSFPH